MEQFDLPVVTTGHTKYNNTCHTVRKKLQKLVRIGNLLVKLAAIAKKLIVYIQDLI